jgi:hypothetical protein
MFINDPAFDAIPSELLAVALNKQQQNTTARISSDVAVVFSRRELSALTIYLH